MVDHQLCGLAAWELKVTWCKQGFKYRPQSRGLGACRPGLPSPLVGTLAAPLTPSQPPPAASRASSVPSSSCPTPTAVKQHTLPSQPFTANTTIPN